MDLAYQHIKTPWGNALLATVQKKISFFGFTQDLEIIRKIFPKENLIPASAKIHVTYDSLLSSYTMTDFYLRGTPFQKAVWNELIKIQPGETRTYSDIARAIHASKAVRAVANAIGQNPISVLIPCHRVIRKPNASGQSDLGGYRWGINIKMALLHHESVTKAA